MFPALGRCFFQTDGPERFSTPRLSPPSDDPAAVISSFLPSRGMRNSSLWIKGRGCISLASACRISSERGHSRRGWLIPSQTSLSIINPILTQCPGFPHQQLHSALGSSFVNSDHPTPLGEQDACVALEWTHLSKSPEANSQEWTGG